MIKCQAFTQSLIYTASDLRATRSENVQVAAIRRRSRSGERVAVSVSLDSVDQRLRYQVALVGDQVDPEARRRPADRARVRRRPHSPRSPRLHGAAMC